MTTKTKDAAYLQLERTPIAEYATYLGFWVDESDSCKGANTVTLRTGSKDRAQQKVGDKIVVFKDTNRYIGREQGDCGSIFGFIMTRTEHKSWKQVFQALKAYNGMPEADRRNSNTAELVAYQAKPRATPIADLAKGWARMQTYTAAEHSYLPSRAIPADVLERFKQYVRVDVHNYHKNTCFVHKDDNNTVVGWEAKNRNADGSSWTSFATGGTKILWRAEIWHLSRKNRIIVGEAPIDLISWAAINRDTEGKIPTGLYLSTAGSFGSRTREALQVLFAENPEAEIITAFDDDDAGRKFAAQVAEMAPGRVTRAIPQLGKDFNECLQMLKEFED